MKLLALWGTSSGMPKGRSARMTRRTGRAKPSAAKRAVYTLCQYRRRARSKSPEADGLGDERVGAHEEADAEKGDGEEEAVAEAHPRSCTAPVRPTTAVSTAPDGGMAGLH